MKKTNNKIKIVRPREYVSYSQLSAWDTSKERWCQVSGNKVSIKSACAKYNINPHTYTRWTRVLNDDRAIT